MNETITEVGFFEEEDMYFEFPIHVEIDSWEKERADSHFPGCSAGAEVCEVTVLEQPSIEDVREAIKLLSGDDKKSEFKCNGVEYELDYDEGILVSDWDNLDVLDSLFGFVID